MGVSRRLLFGSTRWQVIRPATTLTPGHLTVRLTDPAVAFDAESAADWLYCYNTARTALGEVFGAHTFCLFFAYRWHPLGAAIAEPEAESSTPTFHIFGRFAGESTTPGEQLVLPAHRRVPLSKAEKQKYDGPLRISLQRAAAGGAAPKEVAPSDSAVIQRDPETPAGPHHTILSPARGVSFVGGLTAGEILALAAEVQHIADLPSVNGISCLLAEGPSTGQVELHAVARSAGEAFNPLARLLNLPILSQALL